MNTSGTALCSIALLKHSKYDILRKKGIKGIKWLLDKQNSDGSWSDEILGSNRVIKLEKSLFATILSLEALIRSEIHNLNPQIDLCFQWIMNQQNKFGMWEDDKFQPLFPYSSFPLITVLVLELEILVKSYKQQMSLESISVHSLTPKTSFEFDIAVSFAGEDRDIVEKYIRLLEMKSVKVFYDQNNVAELWGKNLVDELHDIYKDKARYCVMFISKNYKEKKWSKHERQAAQERALNEHKDYILPVKLDKTEIQGMPTTVSYINLNQITLGELVNKTIEKLNLKN